MAIDTTLASPESGSSSSRTPAKAPAQVAGSATKHAPARPWTNKRRAFSIQDRQFFTEQLSLLLETGMPMHSALAGLMKQAPSHGLKRLLRALLEDLNSGLPLSRAMAKHPDAFPSTYVSLVEASEGGGFLHEVLRQLQETDTRRMELVRNLRSALSYPVALLFFSVLVVGFVLVVVFPKFGDMFSRIQGELPATTVFFMALSDLLRERWYLVAGVSGGTVLSLRWWLASADGAARMARFKLQAPLISGLYQQLYLLDSLRIMSLSLKNGVSVVDSLRASHDVVDNPLFRGFLINASRTIEEGRTLGQAFDNPFIPDLVRQMITTGEQSGNLAHVTGRIAEHFQVDLERRITQFGKLAEPLLLLFMGALVGLIVSSLLLPIFKLSTAGF
jgi:type II secretory pathway component PulF